MKRFSYWFCTLWFFLSATSAFAMEFGAGSMDVVVSQRFWSDERLGRVNGFSQWGAIGIDASFGLVELPYRFEPFFTFGFNRDTANLPLLDSNGDYALDENGSLQESADDLRYTFLSFTLGLKQRLWSSEFFFIVPFYRIGCVYRFGWVKKETAAVDEQVDSSGGDIGLDLGGGLVVSFFGDSALKSDMSSTWDLRDFGLLAQVRYLPGNWARHGLGLISGTSGWDFGVGLALDW